MKIISFFQIFIVFILSSLKLQAQVFVETGERAKLYVGISNSLTILLNNYDCKDLLVVSSQGRLDKLDNCNYNFVPEKHGEALFQIYKNEILLDEYKMSCVYFPVEFFTPSLSFTYKNYGIYRLSNQNQLIVYADGLGFDARAEIVSFNLSTCSEETFVSFKNSGSVFSEDIQNLINKSTEGQVFCFHDIKIRFSNSIIQTIEKSLIVTNGSQIRFGNNYDVNLYLNCKCKKVEERLSETELLLYEICGKEDTISISRKVTNGDTLFVFNDLAEELQIFELDGIFFKGNYLKLKKNVVIEKGSYELLNTGIDTIYVLDPLTLEEKVVFKELFSSVRSGTWYYYNLDKKLFKTEEYFNGNIISVSLK